MKTNQIVLVLVVLTFAIFACQAPAFPALQPSTSAQPIESAQPVQPIISNAQDPATEQDALVALYEHVSPGTVAIITDQGQGSGFVYDSNGHIVTNYHVIDGAKTVEVRFTSGFMAYGTVVGTDLDSDLAIVKVDAPADELHPLPLGDSSLLKVGQTVIAIGNPFGLNSTMTVGIVSALGRTLDSITGAYVREVVHGRPAEQAGIIAGSQPTNIPGLLGGGDLITAIDGRPVRTFDELLSYLITNKGPGDTIVLSVLRGSTRSDISVTLGKRPQ